MKQDGCAVTAAAIVLRYYSDRPLPDGTTLHPGSLNYYLNSLPIHYLPVFNGNAELYFERAFVAASQSASTRLVATVTRLEHGRSGASDQLVQEELRAGRPVILRVDRQGKNHFVVATGYQLDVDGHFLTYSITDPGDCDRHNLNDNVHEIDYANKYDEVVIIHPAGSVQVEANANKGGIIAFAYAAGLDVIDPVGRHSSPPDSAASLIAFAADISNGGLSDDSVDSPSAAADSAVAGTRISDPIQGTYRAVIKAGSSPTRASLSAFAYDSLGTMNLYQHEVMALSSGASDTVVFAYSPVPGAVVGLDTKLDSGRRALAVRAAPNPAVGSVTVEFDVPETMPLTVGVYDVAGRRMARLAEGTFDAGRHRVVWDRAGAGTSGPGVYFIVLRARSETRVRTAIVLH